MFRHLMSESDIEAHRIKLEGLKLECPRSWFPQTNLAINDKVINHNIGLILNPLDEQIDMSMRRPIWRIYVKEVRWKVTVTTSDKGYLISKMLPAQNKYCGVQIGVDLAKLEAVKMEAAFLGMVTLNRDHQEAKIVFWWSNK